MSRSNHNSGFHFIRYTQNVFEPYYYDRYGEAIAEHFIKKQRQRIDEIINEMPEEVSMPIENEDIVMNEEEKVLEPVEKKNPVLEKAIDEVEQLYSKLFLYAVKNERKLDEISRKATIDLQAEYGDIDGLNFLSYVAKLMGTSIGELYRMDESEWKSILFDKVIPDINEMGISVKCSDENSNCIEAFVSFEDFSDRVRIKDYYIHLREYVSEGKDSLLPDIWTYFYFTFNRVREDDSFKYYVTVRIPETKQDRMCNNYLMYYEAFVCSGDDEELKNYIDKLIENNKS